MASLAVSAAAYDLIKRFEACRLKPYLDATKNLTVGWGHKCTVSAPYAAASITQREADALLIKDVDLALQGIGKFTMVRLSQPQIDALTSLVYNIGVGNYYRSTLRKHLNLSDYRGAAEQFLVWDEINGQHNHWQAQRRLAEHDLFLTGTK